MECIDQTFHELNQSRELFHFRRVINKKQFSLGELPDLARLIPQAGRGNIYGYNKPAYGQLLKTLVECKNVKEVTEYFSEMNISDWLDFLSDIEWESLCLAYLIIEYDYVPTGLRLGGTLKNCDIIGKSRSGRRIIGQCKKSHEKCGVGPDFLGACKSYKRQDDALCFWFSYGGWYNNPGHGIQLIDKNYMEKWLNGKNGKNYLNVLRGKS